MPYITQEQRKELDPFINCLASKVSSSGGLNYAITRLCVLVAKEGLKVERSKYLVFNTIVGVLSCVMLEFYRRVVASYEDKKKKQNGDVFEEVLEELE
ncbi:MAG TPA: hypothetical protein P5140_05630 [Methanofastidiosum sp.]|nr:hypothetical protein [Methanofastidiosum sp.]